MSRPNSPLVGPAPRAFAVGCMALLAGACSSSSSPVAPDQQRAPKAPAVADFVYASDASGTPQIYWSHDGTNTRLTFDNSTDNFCVHVNLQDSPSDINFNRIHSTLGHCELCPGHGRYHRCSHHAAC